MNPTVHFGALNHFGPGAVTLVSPTEVRISPSNLMGNNPFYVRVITAGGESTPYRIELI